MNNKKTKVLLISIFFIIFFCIVLINNNSGKKNFFSARCIKVIDGEKIVVWLDGRWFNNRLKVKLYGIKASDRNTDIGKKARYFVISQISGKLIKIRLINKKLWGWSSAVVYYNGLCLNEQLIKNKLAIFDSEKSEKNIFKIWNMESE